MGRRFSASTSTAAIIATRTSIILLFLSCCCRPSLPMIDAFSPPIIPSGTASGSGANNHNIATNAHRWHHLHHGNTRQFIPSSPFFSGYHNNNKLVASPSGYGSCSSKSTTCLSMSVTGGVAAATATSSLARRILSHGITTFASNWKAYSLIPLVAGFVGWFTNYLAVQMIFYPIKWRGIPIYKVEGEPLGLLGWQGVYYLYSFLLRSRSFVTAYHQPKMYHYA